jgi:Na+/melibiose symporter-like transporter
MNLKSILSYSFQSFYLAGSFLLLFIFLPTFYNLSIGIPLSVIGLVILTSRLFDVISDFLIGYLSEKRIISGRSKKNQILLGIIVFIFSLFGLYVIQSDNIYSFIFFYNLALVSYSIAIIPYDSIVIDQKKILKKRFHLAAIKEIFAILGVLSALIIPTVISKLQGVDLLNPNVIKISGLIFIILAITGGLIFYLFYDDELNYKSNEISWTQLKSFIEKNKKILSFSYITFFNLLANNFTANLFIIFVSEYLGLTEYAGYLLILYFLITLISTPFWYLYGRKFSNMFLLQFGTSLTIFGFLFVIFTNSNSWQIYLFVILITGIGIGIDLIIPQIELADILDQNNDNRLSQIFTSFFSIIKKAAIGIAAGIALTGYGYLQSINFSLHPNIPNIMIFYFFIPLIIKLFVLLLVMRYRSKFHVSIRE